MTTALAALPSGNRKQARIFDQKLQELADSANAADAACNQAARQVVIHARDAGEALLEAKDHLLHGQFGNWLKHNCRFSESTAQRYMRVAKYFRQNPSRVTDLNLEGESLRGVLAFISQNGGHIAEPKTKSIFDGRNCPSCDSALMFTRSGYATCYECRECPLYGTGKNEKRQANYENIPFLHLLHYWGEAPQSDREKFFEMIT